MARLRPRPKYHPVFLKLAAAACVAGLHLAVIMAILASPVTPPDIASPESVGVRFVEIAPDLIATASEATPVSELKAPKEAEVKPDIVPEPEPQLVPEPEVAPVPEPQVEPEPVVNAPEPDAITPELAPPPKVEPKRKPNAKPEIKHRPKPHPEPAPSVPSKPALASVEAASSGAKSVAAASAAPAAPVDPDKPRLIGKVDYLGQRPSPDYPRASVRRGETGRVVVRVLISPQGAVANVSVRTSSGHSRLDEAALNAARSARFKPYTENGVAYSAIADIPFDFVL